MSPPVLGAFERDAIRWRRASVERWRRLLWYNVALAVSYTLAGMAGAVDGYTLLKWFGMAGAVASLGLAWHSAHNRALLLSHIERIERGEDIWAGGETT